MADMIDFAERFARLAAVGEGEAAATLGGVRVRLVRVAGGTPGRWDRHDHTAETVVVWSGDFSVDFGTHAVRLSPGQCCVVPMATDHRGTSQGGAEVILFTNADGGRARTGKPATPPPDDGAAGAPRRLTPP